MTNKVHQTRMDWAQGPEPPSRREVLVEAIAREEKRLAGLEAEQADSKRRVAALEAELAALGAEPGDPRSPTAYGRGTCSTDVGREDQAVPLPLPRAGGCLPDAIRWQEDGQPGLCACVSKQIRQGRLRVAESKVRRVPESGIHPF
jgi:hypothetical protein